MTTARAIACLLMAGCVSIHADAQAPVAPGGLRIQGGAAGRARAQIPQPQKPVVSLSVNQNDLYVNEAVTVTLNPIDDVRKSPFLFTVNFGDGQETRVTQIAQLQHQYKTAGPYTISASVSVPPGAEIFVAMPAVANRVAVNVRAATFSVRPGLAAVGENVVFSTPVRPGDARIRYRFWFTGDESTGWLTESQTTHAYKNAGTYSPTMEVGIFDDNEYRTLDRAEAVQLQVADVTLEAPTSVQSNETATFTVGFPGGDPALRYRVNFADGSTSEWSVSPTVTHSYVAANTYQPFAEIGRASDADVTMVAASAAAELLVNQIIVPGGGGGGGAGDNRGRENNVPGSSDSGWLLYVAVAVIALVAGYGAKQFLFATKPTFTLHRGQTDTQIDSADGGVHVQLEVRLHPNVDTAQTTLTVRGGRLIATDAETV